MAGLSGYGSQALRLLLTSFAYVPALVLAYQHFLLCKSEPKMHFGKQAELAVRHTRIAKNSFLSVHEHYAADAASQEPRVTLWATLGQPQPKAACMLTFSRGQLTSSFHCGLAALF